MERQLLLALGIWLALLFGWQKFYVEPQQREAALRAEVQNKAMPVAAASSLPSVQAVNPPAEAIKPETRTLTLPSGQVVLSNGADFVQSWSLSEYRVGLAQDSAPVDLKNVTRRDSNGVLAFDLPQYAYLADVRGKFSDGPNGSIVWTYEDSNARLTRTLAVGSAPHTLQVNLGVEFKAQRPNHAFVAIRADGAKDDPESHDRQLLAWSDDNLSRLVIEESMKLKDFSEPLRWIGASSRYFLFSVLPNTEMAPKGLVQSAGHYSGRMSLVYPLTGNSVSIPLRLYFGPKELNALRAVESTLDQTVDFGWFTLFAYPLLRVMKWFYGVFSNWGLSIILLTILVKLLTFPLTFKSMKSMKQMAKLQPQLQKLKEKYADDKQALNQEMLTLMRTHGYNPAAGCLPMLVQMPVFFALYRVLYSSIELYHSPFLFWIHDLSSKDPFYVTPVLLTLTMFIQQKLTPNTATDPMQQKMIQYMPLIFGVMMMGLPAGLTIYMLVNALISILQQVIINRVLDQKSVSGVPAGVR